MANLKIIYRAAFIAVLIATALDCEAQGPSVFLADPTVFTDKGKYYLYGTGSKDGFQVYISDDMRTWSLHRDTARRFALRRGQSYGDTGFWAPQVFKHKGDYYMAYTANEQIAIAKGPGPSGPFTQARHLPLSGTGRQIDPFIFFDKDKIYLFHVKLQNGNRIYVSEMKPDLSDVISGTEKECISGTEPWENTSQSEWPVTEGPTVFRHKNTYYLIYSANDFRNKNYAVGYATAGSPTGPWKKYKGNPIISRLIVGYNGPGHGDLFIDKAGNMKYVLHTHHSKDHVSPRATAVVDLQFKTVGDGPDVLEADPASFRWLSIKEQ